MERKVENKPEVQKMETQGKVTGEETKEEEYGAKNKTEVNSHTESELSSETLNH